MPLLKICNVSSQKDSMPTNIASNDDYTFLQSILLDFEHHFRCCTIFEMHGGIYSDAYIPWNNALLDAQRKGTHKSVIGC